MVEKWAKLRAFEFLRSDLIDSLKEELKKK